MDENEIEKRNGGNIKCKRKNLKLRKINNIVF
jgi:hypothetical protein